jgi:hypothetical protein
MRIIIYTHISTLCNAMHMGAVRDLVRCTYVNAEDTLNHIVRVTLLAFMFVHMCVLAKFIFLTFLLLMTIVGVVSYAN